MMFFIRTVPKAAYFRTTFLSFRFDCDNCRFFSILVHLKNGVSRLIRSMTTRRFAEKCYADTNFTYIWVAILSMPISLLGTWLFRNLENARISRGKFELVVKRSSSYFTIIVIQIAIYIVNKA